MPESLLNRLPYGGGFLERQQRIAQQVNVQVADDENQAALAILVRPLLQVSWEQNLRTYLISVETLQQRFAQERAMQQIPVTLADGTTFTLSPGCQNALVPAIITEFAPRFTPGAAVLYVGDTSEKFAHFDRGGLTPSASRSKSTARCRMWWCTIARRTGSS